MRTTALRATFVVACMIGALLTTAAAASADQPIREPLPASDYTLPSNVCGFPVEVTVLTNRELLTTFSNGILAINGALKVRFTNAADPSKLIVVNASGPGRLTPNGDGTFTAAIHGRSFLIFFPGDLGPGSAGALLLTTGLVTEVVNANFQLIPGSAVFTHPAEDLCAQLA